MSTRLDRLLNLLESEYFHCCILSSDFMQIDSGIFVHLQPAQHLQSDKPQQPRLGRSRRFIRMIYKICFNGLGQIVSLVPFILQPGLIDLLDLGEDCLAE